MLFNQAIRIKFSITKFSLGFFLLLLFCSSHKAGKRQIPRYSCFYFQHFAENCIITKQNRSMCTLNARWKSQWLSLPADGALCCCRAFKIEPSIYQGCVPTTHSPKITWYLYRTDTVWKRKPDFMQLCVVGWLIAEFPVRCLCFTTVTMLTVWLFRTDSELAKMELVSRLVNIYWINNKYWLN